jgi:hypothetical protein
MAPRWNAKNPSKINIKVLAISWFINSPSKLKKSRYGTSKPKGKTSKNAKPALNKNPANIKIMYGSNIRLVRIFQE